jgi:hypothetical protein
MMPSQRRKPHYDNSNELRTYHVELEYYDPHVVLEYDWCKLHLNEKYK